MKVILAVALTVVSVSALGSGPYLPSGWRPKGPAFYLPAEIERKPAENPLKETLFQGSEASGSEGLREYGPPKLQEVSNEINQGLPDAVTDQVFQVIQTRVEAIDEKVGSEDISEEKSVVTEVKAVAEQAATVETNSATNTAVIEEKYNVGEAKPAVIDPIKVIVVEPIVAEEEEVVATEKAIAEENAKIVIVKPVVEEKEGVFGQPIVVEEEAVVATEKAVVGDKVEEIAKPVVIEQNTKVVEVEQVFESRALDLNVQDELELSTQISADEEESSEVNFEAETTERIIETAQQAEIPTVAPVAFDTSLKVEADVKAKVNEEQIENLVQKVVEEIQTEVQKVEELKTVVEEVRTVEEGVKTVQEQVQNIGEALVILENEVKAEQIESEVKISGEVSGSLQQAPEGFLEYGPPGFREYGPPQGDDVLRTTVLESLIVEPSNELRKRRFSPRFKPTSKND